MTDPFPGTWRLVSFVARDANGGETSTFGPTPLGYLMYDAGGRMSVHIARSDGLSGSNSAAYFGYFGSYTVDEKARTVTHHVEGASDPRLAGTAQRRFWTLDGSRLVLRTASEEDSGAGVTYVATWRRR